MIEIKARMKNKTLGVSAVGLLLLILSGSAMAQDVPALQELGKHIFFDNISSPPRQSCSTCHVAENGWTGGVAGINKRVWLYLAPTLTRSEDVSRPATRTQASVRRLAPGLRPTRIRPRPGTDSFFVVKV